jgi:hypothetical protein
MRPRHRSRNAKLVFVVLAALVSVKLEFSTQYLLEQHGWPNPGIYVWGLLHPNPRPGFIGPDFGSLLGTEIAVNSVCWFVLLCLAGFTIARLVKWIGASRIRTPPRN